MGFMAGFGPTFAKGINDAYDQQQQNKQDLFKIQYQSYLSEKEEYKKSKREADLIAKQAKTLADSLGDPAAAGKLYDYGMQFGTEAMMKVAEDRRIVRKAGQSQGLGPTGMAGDTTQMQDPNVQQYDPSVADIIKQAKNPQDAWGGMREAEPQNPMTAPGNAMGLSQKARLNTIRDLDAATNGDYSKVMNFKGMDSPFSASDTGAYEILLPEKPVKAGEIQDLMETQRRALLAGDKTRAYDIQLQINTRVMADQIKADINNQNKMPVVSYMERDPQTGIGKAVQGNWVVNADGSKTFRTLSGRVIQSQDMVELNKDQARAIMDWYHDVANKDTYKKFNENAAVAGQLFDLIGRMDTIAERYPDVMNAGGGVASSARGVINNINGLINVAKTELNAHEDPNTIKRIDDALDQGMAYLTLSKQSMDLAESRDLLNSMKTLASYKLAGTLDASGRFSDKDIENALKAISESTDVDSFQNSLAQFGGLVYSKLSQDAGSLSNEIAMSAKGVIVYTGVNPGVDIRTIEERVQGNKYSERALALIQNTKQVYEEPLVPGTEPTPSAGTIPEAAAEYLRQHPELRDQFDAKYGPGSSDVVLGNRSTVPNN